MRSTRPERQAILWRMSSSELDPKVECQAARGGDRSLRSLRLRLSPIDQAATILARPRPRVGQTIWSLKFTKGLRSQRTCRASRGLPLFEPFQRVAEPFFRPTRPSPLHRATCRGRHTQTVTAGNDDAPPRKVEVPSRNIGTAQPLTLRRPRAIPFRDIVRRVQRQGQAEGASGSDLAGRMDDDRTDKARSRRVGKHSTACPFPHQRIEARRSRTRSRRLERGARSDGRRALECRGDTQFRKRSSPC